MSLDSSEYIDLRDAVNDSDIEYDMKQKLLEVLKGAAEEVPDEEDGEDDDDITSNIEPGDQFWSNGEYSFDLNMIVAIVHHKDKEQHYIYAADGTNEPFAVEEEVGRQILKHWKVYTNGG